MGLQGPWLDPGDRPSRHSYAASHVTARAPESQREVGISPFVQTQVKHRKLGHRRVCTNRTYRCHFLFRARCEGRAGRFSNPHAAAAAARGTCAACGASPGRSGPGSARGAPASGPRPSGAPLCCDGLGPKRAAGTRGPAGVLTARTGCPHTHPLAKGQELRTQSSPSV